MKKIIFAFMIIALCLTGCQAQKAPLAHVAQPNEIGGGQNQFFCTAPSVTKQDEYYYYIPNDDVWSGIYRCKLGEEPIRLVKGGYSELQVQNTRLYAFESSGFSGGNLPGLLVFDLNGAQSAELLPEYTLREYLVYKDHIYFTTDDGLYRCALDGSAIETLIAKWVLQFYIGEDAIYYSETVNNEQIRIQQYNIKAKQEKLLYQGSIMLDWCMCGNDLYIKESTASDQDTILYVDIAAGNQKDKVPLKGGSIFLQADQDYLWILTEDKAVKRYSKQTNKTEDAFGSDADRIDLASLPDGIYGYYKGSSYQHQLNLSKLSR